CRARGRPAPRRSRRRRPGGAPARRASSLPSAPVPPPADALVVARRGVLRVVGDAVALAEPVAEIDELAALAAEGSETALRSTLDAVLADRTASHRLPS